MKIAIVYNRESKAVINLFGIPNKEKYGMDTIMKVKNALLADNHRIRLFEGDKNIVENLERFMPKVTSGERPGLVFNLSYGIQGRGRYMHIPGILEMLGIPYVGSGPEVHAIALDKVVTKMVLIQKGIPTPKFAVLETPDSSLNEELRYPLIVKPKSEAVSFGLRIVKNEEELRSGVRTIHDEFASPTLVEEYIDGREVNIGLLGNAPTEVLPPLELLFEEGERIFTFADKTDHKASRVRSVCPAKLDDKLAEKLDELALKTFKALGCQDLARVDFRIDKEGNPYVLEVNSMASLGPDSSFVKAAAAKGLTYERLVQRIINIAAERYFGIAKDFVFDEEEEGATLFSFITQSRDKTETDLKQLTNLYTPTDDVVSKQTFLRRLDARMKKLALTAHEERTGGKSHWLYTTKKGHRDGTLLVVPIDDPGSRGAYPMPFRKEPEKLFGEGIASSRGGLIVVLRALEALQEASFLEGIPLGVFLYADEGHGMRYSAKNLQEAANEAKEVLVMAPAHNEGSFISQRRGTMKVKIVIEGHPLRIGAKTRERSVLEYLLENVAALQEIAKEEPFLSLSVQDIDTARYSILAPHRVSVTIILSYLEEKTAEKAFKKIQSCFSQKPKGIRTYLEILEKRPPLQKRKASLSLIEEIENMARQWKIPMREESTILPSAAGTIPAAIPVVCGMAPSSKRLYTPQESINRQELVQKTILLAQLLRKRHTS